MEVWQKQLTLVLFTVAVEVLMVSGQRHVILDNTTKTVDVLLGDPLILHCALGIDKYERSRVQWLFNRNGPSLENSQNISDDLIIQLNHSTTGDVKKEEANRKAIFSISNFTDNDTGWYFCEVTSEIPLHHTNYSNGTYLLILQSSEKTTHPSVLTSKQVTSSGHLPMDWWMWVVLGVSSFILIMVLLLTFVFLRIRCIRNRDEDPIYTNMPAKQPSPRPRTEQSPLKTDPSSQNLCTPNHGRRYEEARRKQRQ